MSFSAGSTPLTTFTLEQLRQRTSEKWVHYPADVLPLWVAEMDSTIAEPVAEVIRTALSLADTGYSSGNDYGVAFSEFAAARWNWSVDPDDTVLVVDVMRGIGDVIRLTTDPEASVIVTPPVYYPFFRVTEALGRNLVHAPLTADGRLNPESMELALAEVAARGRGGIVLLCNPHNPTGVAHTRAELQQLAAQARRYDVRLVVDEIHAPLVMPGVEFVPILTVPGAENAIVITSASKSFNLAGLKAALIVAGAESRETVRGMRGRIFAGETHWGQLTHAAALRHGTPWLDAVVADIAANSRLLTELLPDYLPGAVYRPVEATYLAWVDCRALGLGDDPGAHFVEHGRVAFSSGHVFGPGGAGHVRVNLATHPDILTEAMRRAGQGSIAR
jgi:cystathionine beta-lyase